MNPDTHPRPFTMDIPVAEADIDVMGHVNNTVYLRWVQDVAVAHWQALASPEEQSAVLWVVTRHEIDYKRPVYRQDEVTARTWVGEAGSRDFKRHTELVRRSDGKLLAAAVTSWCPVDAETLRPCPVDDGIRAKFSTSGS